jgi:chemotaxis protein histidine kinase CheA
MALRDRFYTPATAKAILSWRIALGAAFAVVAGLLGVWWPIAIVGGIAVYAISVALAMPHGSKSPKVDPFTLSEPWRSLVQSAQVSQRKFRETIAGVPAGPLREELHAISAQLDRGISEAWRVAQAGDDIDDVVRRVDPAALRSKLASAQQRAAADPSSDNAAAVSSIQEQIASAERLKQQSEQTAATLRVNQAQLDSLVTRAAEVRIGTADTDAYADQVDELVLKLEALRQAVEETNTE